MSRAEPWPLAERVLNAAREELSTTNTENPCDDGHVINGFSVGMELICSDYCSLKGSLFL